MTLYVRMTDKFMSGWGLARNKKNVLVIECTTAEQAEQIERAAHKRKEMKYIQICLSTPRDKSNTIYTYRTFDDMGGVWKE